MYFAVKMIFSKKVYTFKDLIIFQKLAIFYENTFKITSHNIFNKMFQRIKRKH